MKSLLLFIAALGTIVLVAWTVSKVTGSRSWYIEDWTFDDGETVLWRDDASDSYLIHTYGQALFTSFARPRRGFVVVTNRRVIIGMKPLFGSKRMVQYVLSTKAAAADGPSKKLDGGLLTVGYQTIILQDGVIEAHLDEKKPFVDLRPLSREPSSTNIDKLRIFSDSAASFRLP